MNFYWDYETRKLVAAVDSVMQIDRADLAGRDTEPFYVAYLTQAAVSGEAPYVIDQTGATETMYFTVKENRDDVDALIGPITLVDNGQAGDARRYAADVSLNVAALNTLLDAETTLKYIEVEAELTVRANDGSERHSTQFILRVDKDVLRAGTGSAQPIVSGNAVKFITDENGNKGTGIYNEDGVELVTFYPPGV